MSRKITFEFFASQVEAIDDYLYIGFSGSNGGEHYFIMTRDEKSPEAAKYIAENHERV